MRDNKETKAFTEHGRPDLQKYYTTMMAAKIWYRTDKNSVTNQTYDTPKYGDRKCGKKTWYRIMGLYFYKTMGWELEIK